MSQKEDPETPRAIVLLPVIRGSELETELRSKTREIEKNGWTLWGYGEIAIHPIAMLQPFAGAELRQDEELWALGREGDGKTNLHTERACRYSTDSLTWHKVPGNIEVRGRYALVIDRIEARAETMDLGKFLMGTGPSQGREAAGCRMGCLVQKEPGKRNERPVQPVSTHLRARLVSPHAVLLDSRTILKKNGERRKILEEAENITGVKAQ